jgi:predicted AAA+ superfamily ATPase
MYLIKRTIFADLKRWASDPFRKVLLLRGARQVGKTFIVRELGKEFESFVEVNLADQPILKTLFAGPSLDPDAIISALSAYTGQAIIDGKTLLFIDEIQACPEAIAALRFFYEKRPRLHLIASGSLLEFALGEISSFGVGRVECLYMYPLTFEEFLNAKNEHLLLAQIKTASAEAPLGDALHAKSLTLLKTYLMLGGMPEVLARFLGGLDITQIPKLLSTLITGYEDDFSKYRDRLSANDLRETFRSVAQQAGKKFVYSHAFRDANPRVVHKALDLLVKAGIVQQVFHTSANGVPIGGELNPSKFKALSFDIGIFNQLTGVPLADLAVLDPFLLITKRALAEVYTGLHLLWHAERFKAHDLFYWHREAKSSNAELDYVIQVHERIVPIEVKASGKGAMHSMHAFLKEKKCPFGIRISTENFTSYNQIRTVPLYAVSEIPRIVARES